ncbi:DUF6463 family protein [Allokutzneria sp. NRRL B-24872]|uniref:DUF6463 family protein n=1 Tax=Allokutzneria sp. NRRL B-24872 TaxID=1137961 RepID=UPI000A3938FD|nr:DUF6463 family protein [Allokutzneria sp. NRRL B-24872]
MTITNGQLRATTSRAWWRSASAWGGGLAVCGGLLHTVVAGFSRPDAWSQIFAEGIFGTLTLDPPPERLALAEAFWFSVGSFGVPLLLLGGLVLHVVRRGGTVPAWVGLGLIAWAVLIGLLGSFDAGTIILITIGALLAIGSRTRR